MASAAHRAVRSLLIGKATKKAAGMKARSGYNFFVKQNFDRVKSVVGTSEMAVVGSALGAEWSGMSDVDRRPYATQSSEDKARIAALEAASVGATAAQATFSSGTIKLSSRGADTLTQKIVSTVYEEVANDMIEQLQTSGRFTIPKVGRVTMAARTGKMSFTPLGAVKTELEGDGDDADTMF